jgi:hypothetical protein
MEAGGFQRHTVVSDACHAATCRLVDWDVDGDLDLIVPPHRFDRTPSPTLTVYFNQTF